MSLDTLSFVALKAMLGKRNKANNDGAADWGLGLTYDMGDGLSVSAMASGAQTSKVGDAGKARLVLGVTKSF